MAEKPSIYALADEMTGGNTEDPIEAFEQWKAERAALSEFADISQAQDLILARLSKQWAIVAGLLWGKGKPPSPSVRFLKPAEFTRLQEAGEALDQITKRIAELAKAEAQATAYAAQLPLFQQGKKGE